MQLNLLSLLITVVESIIEEEVRRTLRGSKLHPLFPIELILTSEFCTRISNQSFKIGL
jgi:hypothetical protein